MLASTFGFTRTEVSIGIPSRSLSSFIAASLSSLFPSFGAKLGGDWKPEQTRRTVPGVRKEDGIIMAAEGDNSVPTNLGCYGVQAASPQTQACKWDFKTL